MGDADAFRPSDEDPVWLLIRDRLAREDDWSDVLVGDQIQAVRRAVTAQLVDVESQMAAARARRDSYRQQCYARGQTGKREWFASAEEYENWRSSALHFQRLLKARIARIKYAERQYLDAAQQNESHFYRDIIRRMALAIADHQDDTSDDQEPSTADARLWSLLDEIRIPMGRQLVTLASMLPVWFEPDEPAR